MYPYLHERHGASCIKEYFSNGRHHICGKSFRFLTSWTMVCDMAWYGLWLALWGTSLDEGCYSADIEICWRGDPVQRKKHARHFVYKDGLYGYNRGATVQCGGNSRFFRFWTIEWYNKGRGCMVVVNFDNKEWWVNIENGRAEKSRTLYSVSKRQDGSIAPVKN